jgi:TonB family protein
MRSFFLPSSAGIALITAAVALAPNRALAAEAAGGVPTPLEQIPVVYPYDLAMAGVEGDAEVQFNIDADGVTREAAVVSASRPAFGLAAKGMIEALHFAPSIRDGKPVARTGLKQEVRFAIASLDADTKALLDELKKPQPGITRARELDTVPPKVKRAVNPVYPQSLLAGAGEGAKGGEAVIECIIDANGRVQLPRIISATTEDCGWAAATALLRWQFAPPTKGGKAVATRIRIPLEFVPPKADATP